MFTGSVFGVRDCAAARISSRCGVSEELTSVLKRPRNTHDGYRLAEKGEDVAQLSHAFSYLSLGKTHWCLMTSAMPRL